MWEHRNKISHGFTKKYEISLLVHYEVFEDPSRAIEREKQLKKWNRAWKIKLIEENNKEWNDLYESLG